MSNLCNKIMVNYVAKKFMFFFVYSWTGVFVCSPMAMPDGKEFFMYLSSPAIKSLAAFCVLAFLPACQPELPTSNKYAKGDSLGVATHESLAYGRQSAAYRHLSQVWQISHIDNTPIPTLAYLDLTQISNGKALVRTSERCRPISVAFNTKNIATGQIHVTRIERVLDDCADDFEDKLMSIVADTRRLDKGRDGQMVLISYGHTLTLSPPP